jgi:alcohol dehydrogenase class IV
MDLVRGAAAPVSRAPLYCAPTTAGSGSEATHFAVVYIGREKYSLAGEALLARAVAVDPLLSASMPPYLTACSGFDAVCHAVESWWARGADAESRGYAARALKLLLPNIEEAVTAPTPHARRNMAEGAYWAGRAINVSKTTAPHAFSYHLTSAYSIPHGHAVALALGTFWRVNEPAIPPGLLAALGQPSAGEAGRFWRDLMERCGLETRLSVLGVEPEAAEEMAKSVNAERLGNNPVALDGAGVLDAARRMAAPDGNKPRARD